MDLTKFIDIKTLAKELGLSINSTKQIVSVYKNKYQDKINTHIENQIKQAHDTVKKLPRSSD